MASLRSGLPAVLATLASLAGLPAAPPASAQVATVEVEENFRLEPNGTIVAEISPGTVMLVEGRQGGWVQTELEGWVWARSLQVVDQGGFDLVVSADEGENLRAEPQGPILARLRPGTLLQEVERTPGWILARRTAWIWSQSVTVTETGRRVEPGPASGEARAEEGDTRETASGAVEGPADAGADVPGTVAIPPSGAPLLTSPDGDTLARVIPGTRVQALAREGSWVRVRMEGWSWIPEAGADAPPAAEAEPLPDATPASVRADPAAARGRRVSWELQFISLERADRVRTEFYEGEPFLLTRPSDGGGGFVYVAVPPDRLGEVEDLTPLERIRVVGRVRTGASALTGSPILDLVEVERRTGDAGGGAAPPAG